MVPIEPTPEIIITDGALVANPAVVDKLYKDWQKEQELKKKRTKGSYCNCVTFSKALTGYNQSVGAARNWPQNVDHPVVGGVVITNESASGHVGVIISVDGNSFTILEANYIRCAKGQRVLNINDPRIRGFWSPNE